MLAMQSTVIAQTVKLDSLLTPEEVAWLKDNGHNIRYAPNPSWPPGDYMEDGVHKGIVSDYIKKFEQKLGVTFQRVYFDNWTEIIDGLKNSEIDFVGGIHKTDEREEYLSFTQSFHNNTLGIIVKATHKQPFTDEYINTMKLACIENYTSTMFVKQKYPGAEIIEFSRDFEALMSTSFDETDGAVVDFMTASYLVNEHGINNLQFAKQLDFSFNLHFASIKEKPQLASILDKLLSTITKEQRQEIVNRWIGYDIYYEPSFYERNKMLIWGAVILIVAFVLLVIRVNRYLQKQIRLKTVELVTARDIAIRKEKESRSLFMDHAAVKLLIDPETGNFIDANKAAASFYGWPLATLKEMNISQINKLPIKDFKQEMEEARMLKKNAFEHRHRKADGSEVDVEVFRSGIKIGDKVYLHSIVHDISERKKAEQEIIYHLQIQEMLRAMATSFINIPLELIDKEIQKSLEQLGHFVKADRVYVFDYDWVNYTCRNSFEWCNEGIEPQIDDLQNVPLDEISQLVNTHKLDKAFHIPDVFKLPANDGVRKMLEPLGIKSILTIPVIQNDLCEGFIGFDSVRKQYTFTKREEKILFMFSQQFLNVKTRQILENSLVKAKKKAEKSDKLKTAFINNISHEIRTPLNGILGFGQFLVESELSEEDRRDYFEHVVLSSDRLMNTVTDYMDMAMIISGTLEVHKKEFVLQPFFEETTKNISQLCAKKDIVFYTELPPESVPFILSCDPEIIRKVLDKLLDNAIKFTKEGHITSGYIVKTGHVEFFVKDTGCGIGNKMLGLIFEMFRQADNSITQGHEGSGLGLTIAKGLVTLLGGQIHVTSEKGKGSEFTFTIPGNNIKLLQSAEKHPRKINEDKSLLLVVEDDNLNYLFLQKILASSGYKYIRAFNGLEAVNYCKQNPDISIVLMDIQMPIMNGIEATRQIREFRPELPIIATTAYAQIGNEHSFLETGFNDYLAKPIKKEKLLALISKYVGQFESQQFRSKKSTKL